jgi:hypothetical protein
MSRRVSFLWLLLFLAGSVWIHGGIGITGTVALADGSPVGVPVQVQFKCHGSVVLSVYTSPEGLFTFATSTGRFDASIGGQTKGLPTDAGKRAFGRVDLRHCQIEASLAGYESEPVRLGVLSAFDNSDIGIIHLYPIGNMESSTVSVTTASAPKNAMKASRFF